MLLLAVSLAAPVSAAEVEWAGEYRARGLIYDSLSLSRTNDQAEGTATMMDHRFRLRPTFFVNSNVSLNAQLDMLALAGWGDSADTWYDPVTGDNISLAYADGVQPWVDDEDAGSYRYNIQLTRAWADVYTGVGRVRFGRMPLHWGAGIQFNDGLATDAEYGDTSDRVQFSSRVGQVYLMGAWDIQYEGYLGVPDDMKSLDFAVAYRSETVGLGLYNRYRFQPDQAFNAYTGDLWGMAELGPVTVQTEVVATFGSGNLDADTDDISISAVGAVLEADLRLDNILGGIEGGVATGDEDPTDEKIHTFSFDRDHNVALMMFEEAMPVLESAVINDTNGGRDYDAVRTGDGVSNALYLRPWIGYQVRPDLAVDLSYLAARAAKLPADEDADSGYGMEFDFSAHYAPYENFWLQGTLGVFLPGPYYSNYEHTDLGSGFEDVTLGGRLFATVEF